MKLLDLFETEQRPTIEVARTQKCVMTHFGMLIVLTDVPRNISDEQFDQLLKMSFPLSDMYEYAKRDMLSGYLGKVGDKDVERIINKEGHHWIKPIALTWKDFVKEVNEWYHSSDDDFDDEDNK